MQVAYIVTVDLEVASGEEVSLEAEYIMDTLEQNGVSIISVNPYAREDADIIVNQSYQQTSQPSGPDLFSNPFA